MGNSIMKTKRIALIIAVSVLITLILPGCSGESAGSSNNAQTNTASNKENNDIEDELDEWLTEPIEWPGLDNADEKIKNTYAMLYYLAFTSENIRSSKNNKLILEDIYTEFFNNINPDKIDARTQDQINNLCSIIDSYLDIGTKRERLQYIYNQNKAAAMRKAVPNPLAVITVVGSLDWKRLVASTLYTAVDSYSSYKSAKNGVDKEYLLSGWELDDEQIDTVRKNRKRAYEYMIEITRENNLDGLSTLTEEDIEDFVSICQDSNVTRKIEKLKDKRDRYELCGSYWLELADCYFEKEQYSNVLKCVENYNSLSIGIYRKDLNYAKVLPKAIVAAQHVYENDPKKYNYVINKYAEEIDANTPDKDWAERYFCAQVYLDLYAHTNATTYLKKAYDITKSNINMLSKEQENTNNIYIADVKEIALKEPNYNGLSENEKEKAEDEFKEEKKRVKEYNKQLKKERKTELPSMYEPLILNCELLFNLIAEHSEELEAEKITKNELVILDEILKDSFIVLPIKYRYSIEKKDYNTKIDLQKKEIIIPVTILSAGAQIEITIKEGNEEIVVDDYTIESVEREGKTVDKFYAHIESKKWKKYEWTTDTHVIIKIKYADAYDEELVLKYKVSKCDDHWYGDKVEFEKE